MLDNARRITTKIKENRFCWQIGLEELYLFEISCMEVCFFFRILVYTNKLSLNVETT